MTEEFIKKLENSEIIAKVGIGPIKIGMSRNELEALYTADEIEDRNIYLVYKTEMVWVWVLKETQLVESLYIQKNNIFNYKGVHVGDPVAKISSTFPSIKLDIVEEAFFLDGKEHEGIAFNYAPAFEGDDSPQGDEDIIGINVL